MNDTSVILPARADDSSLDIIEELPVAYIEINSHGLIIRANRAARALYSLVGGPLTGKTLWDIMEAGQREMSRTAFFKVMESGEEPPPVRRSLYTNEGEYRTFELHRSLIRDTQGRPAGIRIVSFDVSEAQFAHEKAHQARQWLESVLASVAEAVIVTDALGFVRYANPAAEAMFGWSAQELIGRVIEKRIPLLYFCSTGKWELSFQMALEGPSTGTATVLTRTQEALQVNVSASPIIDREKGYTVGVVSVWHTARQAA
jgi:PAS domain S-box-containing protein